MTARKKNTRPPARSAANSGAGSPEGYQLVDFGEGRKLESFAGRLLDRPSPAAEGERRRHRAVWQDAESVFDPRTRRWSHRKPWPKDSLVAIGGVSMPTFPSPFGHVGIFPEQATNWRWLQQTAPTRRTATGEADSGNLLGLNLFAYTGGSTIAMAQSGMAVAHVDAAKPSVTAARRAAAVNGLADHPIRYLVDEAGKFAARELRRQKRYHTIVLDPPAYGHGPGGKAWRLERDLWPLLTICLSLVRRDGFRLLVTGHSPQVGAGDVVEYLDGEAKRLLGIKPAEFDSRLASGRLSLTAADGRRLDAGFYVRWNHQETNQ